MITQAGQVLVQLADNIMVGHLGAAELAGVSFANAIIMIGLVFAIGFTQGVTPVIGQHFGKGDGRAVASALCNSAVLNTVMAVVLTGIMLTVGAFMDRMGQDPEVLAHAKDYYFIIVAGFIPMIAFFNVRFFSEGIGNTRNEMWITIGTNLINIFLNWVGTHLRQPRSAETRSGRRGLGHTHLQSTGSHCLSHHPVQSGGIP